MSSTEPISGDAFAGRNVVVALSGGIACYKVATLVSRLVQARAEVTVIMTPAATRFVGPLTFQSLSGRPVYTSQWEGADHHDAQHVGLARSAHLMILAPASANTIAKLAAGICDNVVTTVACALPRQTPVLLAPAMNEQMWENPVTQDNVAKLTGRLGYQTVGPASGWQACRSSGAGRMAEPEQILEKAGQLLVEKARKEEVRGKK